MSSPYRQARSGGAKARPGRTRQIRTLDLFAGAGGLSLGFEQSGLGYKSVFAVEVEPAAARTFKRNFGCPCTDGPIEDIEHVRRRPT